MSLVIFFIVHMFPNSTVRAGQAWVAEQLHMAFRRPVSAVKILRNIPQDCWYLKYRVDSNRYEIFLIGATRTFHVLKCRHPSHWVGWPLYKCMSTWKAPPSTNLTSSPHSRIIATNAFDRYHDIVVGYAPSDSIHKP